LYGDDKGKICFNAAKSWQSRWYDDRKLTLYPEDESSTWQTNRQVIGVANYGEPSTNNIPVLIKLETDSSTDYFMTYNRATGINSQNDEADNEVTIVKTGSNGLSYSQSWLQATLRVGEQYTINGLGRADSVIVRYTSRTTSSDGVWIANVFVGTNRSPGARPSETCLWELDNNMGTNAYGLCEGMYCCFCTDLLCPFPLLLSQLTFIQPRILHIFVLPY